MMRCLFKTVNMFSVLNFFVNNPDEFLFLAQFLLIRDIGVDRGNLQLSFSLTSFREAINKNVNFLLNIKSETKVFFRKIMNNFLFSHVTY